MWKSTVEFTKNITSLKYLKGPKENRIKAVRNIFSNWESKIFLLHKAR